MSSLRSNTNAKTTWINIWKKSDSMNLWIIKWHWTIKKAFAFSRRSMCVFLTWTLFVRKRKIYDKYISKTSHIAIQRSQIEKQNNNDFIEWEEHKKLWHIDDTKIMTFLWKNENVQFARHRLHVERQ